MKYDILIKGGKALDIAVGLDHPMDIGVRDGKITNVSSDLNPGETKKVIEADGFIVTPGLIDFHAHAFFLSGIGLGSDLDNLCASTGVTALIDAGSAGAATFPVLKESMIDRVATRLYAFLHISSIGLADLDVGESTYLDLHNPERAAQMTTTHPDVILGMKVRQQFEVVGENGLKPLQLAKQAAALAGNLPTMVHVTHPPVPLDHILELLEPGDIVSHFLHGKRYGILTDEGKISPKVTEARQRGVVFDVGHGRNHVDFNIAKIAIMEGFLPDTISSDLTRAGMTGIIKNLPHTLSKFMNLGMDVGSVIACATSNPARFMGLEGTIGTLRKDAMADIAIFELESGEYKFEDAEGNVMQGENYLSPRYTIRKGNVAWQYE